MLETNVQDREVWKEIAGFESRYAVSSKGRVKNLKNGKILKNVIDPHGYLRIKLGRGNMRRIHRLVAQAFIPNPLNLPQINHIDECKSNNNVENLEWVTPSQNQRHSAHKFSCRINQYTLDGEFIKTWGSSHEINRELGYYQCVIIYACKNKIKQAYGYRWQYADPSQQQKHNRPVVALTMDGDLIAEYKSAAEASRCLKISESCLRKCLYGYTKSTHGYKFKYID